MTEGETATAGMVQGQWTKVLIVVVGNMSTTTRGGVDETFTHRGFNAPVKVSTDELVNTMVDFFQEITLSILGAQVLRNDGIVPEGTLKSSAVRCYVGELAGQPVTTGLTITTGAFTGIINITTDPRYRGRGFGTAITARAVTDGLAAGASWCWLQSSAQGYPIYKSYGFQLIESWPTWLSQP
jgi:ribosomal protein S18 acetylase RimI-like enzyme